MTSTQIILLGVGAVAIFAAVGAFAVAFRRSTGQAPWRSGVSKETLAADRPATVELTPAVEAEAGSVAVLTIEADEVEPEHEPEPVPVRAITVAAAPLVVEASPEEAGVSRRQFFNRAIGTTFAVYGGGLSLGFLAFLWPKVTGGFGGDVIAGNVNDIRELAFTAEGGINPVFIPEARAWLVPVDDKTVSQQFAERNVVAGGFFALYQRCVHLGCRVPWCATSQGFECPCHGSKYNAIGEYFGGPAPRNLDRFVVTLDGDDLIVKTGSIVETPRAPVRSVLYPQGPSCIA